MVSSTGSRRAGVSKVRDRKKRLDRDGDMLMGAAPVTAPPPRQLRNAPIRGSRQDRSVKTSEVKVVGWSSGGEKSINDLLGFLTRHANKRTAKRHNGAIIKSHRIVGDTVFVRVNDEDISVFIKLNGFEFAGQKLSISDTSDRSRSLGNSQVESASQPNETKEILKDLLTRRYNPETKVLDLSSLASDIKLQEIGMFRAQSTQIKFFQALMKVCDEQFKTSEEKKETIVSVSLADNALSNLSIVSPLAHTLPDIRNLDLTGNNLASTKDLAMWKNKFRHLDLLILAGNPIVSQTDWEKTITAWFPRLRTLNSLQVRSDAEVALFDRPKETPMPSSGAVWSDVDGIAEKFLLDFFPTFDTDREGLVTKYYDSTSKFSLSVNSRAKGGAKQHERTPWDAYIKLSRNIKIIGNPKARHDRQQIGPDQIRSVWMALPATRHPNFQTDLQKYSLECVPQHGLPDPTGQFPLGVIGLMVTVHGEFEEHFTQRGADAVVHRCFDRTFILGPGGPTGIRVVSEQWNLRAYGGIPAWIPIPTADDPAVKAALKDLSPENQKTVLQFGLSAEQLKMLVDFHGLTGMTFEFSRQCLDTSGWDSAVAWNLFTEQKPNLGPEAFA